MISWAHRWHDHLPTHSWWEIDGLQPSAVEYNNSFGFVVVLHVIAEEMLIIYPFFRPLTSTWQLCQAGYQWSFLFHIIYIWSQHWRRLYLPTRRQYNIIKVSDGPTLTGTFSSWLTYCQWSGTSPQLLHFNFRYHLMVCADLIGKYFRAKTA